MFTSCFLAAMFKTVPSGEIMFTNDGSLQCSNIALTMPISGTLTASTRQFCNGASSFNSKTTSSLFLLLIAGIKNICTKWLFIAGLQLSIINLNISADTEDNSSILLMKKSNLIGNLLSIRYLHISYDLPSAALMKELE